MHVAVVYAHPCDESFVHAVFETAVAALTAAGHTVDVLDLYASDFVAAMTAQERVAYHSADPVCDPQVGEHAALARRVDALVFVYPTWWTGVPSVLKGWLERVMLPGVAFVFDANGKVRPGLRNVRRIVGISTYGSPWLRVKAANDNGRRIITRALRLNTGVRTRTTWLGMYAMDTSTAEQRAAFLAKVSTRLAKL